MFTRKLMGNLTAMALVATVATSCGKNKSGDGDTNSNNKKSSKKTSKKTSSSKAKSLNSLSDVRKAFEKKSETSGLEKGDYIVHGGDIYSDQSSNVGTQGNVSFLENFFNFSWNLGINTDYGNPYESARYLKVTKASSGDLEYKEVTGVEYGAYGQQELNYGSIENFSKNNNELRTALGYEDIDDDKAYVNDVKVTFTNGKTVNANIITFFSEESAQMIGYSIVSTEIPAAANPIVLNNFMDQTGQSIEGILQMYDNKQLQSITGKYTDLEYDYYNQKVIKKTRDYNL